MSVVIPASMDVAPGLRLTFVVALRMNVDVIKEIG
jgi:hypothetical protein